MYLNWVSERSQLQILQIDISCSDTAPLFHVWSNNSHLEKGFLQKRLKNVGLKRLLVFSLIFPACVSSHCSISLCPEHRSLSDYQISQPTSLSVLPLSWQHKSSSFFYITSREGVFVLSLRPRTQLICKNLCFFALTAGGQIAAFYTTLCYLLQLVHSFLSSASLFRVRKRTPFSGDFQSSPHTSLAEQSYSHISYQSKGRMGLTARTLEVTRFSVLEVKGKK